MPIFKLASWMFAAKQILTEIRHAFVRNFPYLAPLLRDGLLSPAAWRGGAIPDCVHRLGGRRWT